MILLHPHDIVRRHEMKVNSTPVICWDTGPDTEKRIIAWQDVDMWASGVRHSLRYLLDNADLLFRKAVEIVYQLIDLFVGRVDLALNRGLFVVCFRRG